MSNSSLVAYKLISPNKTTPRNHKIDTITIHCTAGQVSIQTLGSIFSRPNRKASANYGIGEDGRIGMYVEESDRSWCSSNADNDNRAITIECSSESKAPYAISDKVYASLIVLLVDICKRNGITKLLWKGDKNLIGNVQLQNMTVHRWFANKACPGDYIYSRLGKIATEVNAKMITSTTSVSVEQSFISKIAPIVQKYRSFYGYGVTSAIIAQACLESNYGRSNKVVNNGVYTHNYFGMKYRPNRVDCSSGVFEETGSEQNADGSYTPIKTQWFKFDSMDAGVKGYFEFISISNYAGARDQTDPFQYLTALKYAKYATSIDYVVKNMNVIKKWGLTKYDVVDSGVYYVKDSKGNKYPVVTIKKGDKGNTVKFAQQLLMVKAGYNLGASKDDGVFGTATLNAVKSFQKKWGFTVDGVIGITTWTKLASLL